MVVVEVVFQELREEDVCDIEVLNPDNASETFPAPPTGNVSPGTVSVLGTDI